MRRSAWGRALSYVDRFRDPRFRFPEQYWYGHRETFLLSLGLDEDAIVCGHMQHGWRPDAESQESFKILGAGLERFGTHMTWSVREAKAARRSGLRAVAGPSPWARLISGSTGQVSCGEPQRPLGGIYFPRHSAMSLSTNSLNIPSLRKSFSDLRTVCLAWGDYLNAHLRHTLESEGLSVVCAGYRGDSRWGVPWSPMGDRRNFLQNLRRFLAAHEYVLTDHADTAMLSASSMGKTVLINDSSITRDDWSKTDLRFHEARIECLVRVVGPGLRLDAHQGIIRDWSCEELGFNLVSKSRDQWGKVPIKKVPLIENS